ncbi:MAG: endonuclease III [Candidatus Aenigmatarchaeota archaeon]
MNRKEKMRILLKFIKKRYNTENYFARNKFRLLVSTILSQRTRDENTAVAAERLFRRAKTPTDIIKLKNKELEQLVYSSGFYKQKARRIKVVCSILIERYDGKVPKKREELLSLPGVGYKTADIVLSYGYRVPTIAVDTHVNRIPKRIGLIDEKANVEEVRKELEELTEKADRFIVNLGLIQFGREFCKPVKPSCNLCPISRICSYYKIFKQANHIY